jgi:WD40 repeat protein
MNGSAAWSPDGQMLASVSVDRTIRVWEAAMGKQIRAFAGHEDSVYSVSWSPDGEKLVSGSFDTTLLIWDIGPGEVREPDGA